MGSFAVSGLVATTFGLDGWMEKAALVAITLVVTVILFGLIRFIVPRADQTAAQSQDPVKWQQRRTAVALLATVLRYTVLVVAIITIITILAGAGGIGALGGSAILAVMIGFATQRLLTDVIAGFFILFEGQYGVGDIITLEPSKTTGVVEALGVRTTLVQRPDGSRTYVPNGQISAVTRYRSAQASVLVTVLTRSADAVRDALADVARLAEGTGEIIGPPRDEEVIEMGDAIHAVRVRLRVPSARLDEAIIFVRTTLDARLGDQALGDVLVTPVPRAQDDLIGPVEAS